MDIEDLDPQIARVLEQHADAPVPESIEDIRTGYDRTSLLWVGEAEEVGSIRDVPVGECCVRVYEPVVPDGGAARGVVLYLHGGGWIMGNLTSHDPLCRALANRAGAVVVSVDYRLAPETQFPGPLEDCEAALAWVASEYAGEPVAVAGDSAGANLATVLARRARDAGGPEIAFQLLFYPPTDAACASTSYQTFGADEGFGLGREQMLYCWAAYATGNSARSPDVSPLRAADLSRMPPAYVALASHDPLTDEASDYADRLRAAGVEVEVKVWPGTVHGFIRWRAGVDVAHAALDEAAARVRAALAAA